MPGPDPHHPRVFISYSHDSLEHSDRVRELSDRLRADGIDCILDQYEASPMEGWPRWTDNQISDADFVMMVCTETYYRRVMGKEQPGLGLGVRWEGNSIYQHIYNAQTLNAKFLPVLLDLGRVEDIPTPLQGVARYAAQTDQGYEELYRRLTDQPLHLKPELGNVRKLQPLEPKRRQQGFFASSLTHLPFERNPFFTGREEILRDLREAFLQKGSTQAISGLGGLGKTQTAIEYAYRHRDEYKTVLWSRADSHLALGTGFVEIARGLDLPEKDAQNPDDAVRALKVWLDNSSDWLLIFDNADTPELLKAFRPRNARGHILLTSRAQVFDALGIVKPFEINVMLPGEALQFLLTRTGRKDDNVKEREAAAQISEELGYLPLALEQAGAFIIAKRARFQDYVAAYRKRRGQFLNESHPVTGDYPDSVATTWALNFQEIRKVSEASSDLLRMSAFLSPDQIPLELITKGKGALGDALSAALAGVDDDPLALNEVLESLTRYSFIHLDTDSQSYSIHRLVQEVLRDGMDADTQRLWAERIVVALNQAFPEVDFDNWPLCERLRPQVKSAGILIEKWDITSREARHLLNQAGFYSYERGQYNDTELLYKQSLAIGERALGPEHPDVALRLNNLALLYSVQGKYAESEQLLKRALAIKEKSLGPDDVGLASSLHNLASLYSKQGKYADGETLFKRSLALSEQRLGPDDPAVATSLNNLGELYRKQGKYAEAERLLKRSLAIDERVLGLNHPGVATDLNNLASVYYEQGKYSEADPLFRRALEVKETSLGLDHPEVAISLNNLAFFYHAQQKYLEAEPLFKRSVAALEKVLGSNHPHVALALQNYASLLRSMQRDIEATEMDARAAAILTRHALENLTE